MNETSPFSTVSAFGIGEIFEGFYLGFFNRYPDLDGLAYWKQRALETQNLNITLNEFLSSDEYARIRTWQQEKKQGLIDLLAANVSRPINVLDVGSILIEDEKAIWGKLSNFCDLNVFGFDPQGENTMQVIPGMKDLRISNFDLALGDGRAHTFYINNEINTSSFYPILENSDLHHLSTLKTVATRIIETHKLDDIRLPEWIDFFKIDVQGFELEILKHGVSKLDKTGLLHIEVTFNPIYEGQALFSEVDTFLRSMGFQLLDIVPFRYPHTGVGSQSSDFLVWGDALYRKIPASHESRSIQNLILGTLFEKWNLAEFGNC
jgi:FkbM family methyltransferase